jgi:exonuclease SbcC
VDLLRSLHDRFEQVVLITHIDAVRDGLDRVLTVRYDEPTGASKVEECLPPLEEEMVEALAAPPLPATRVAATEMAAAG